jgi:N-sulfoglucosamine sulfohydrolase
MKLAVLGWLRPVLEANGRLKRGDRMMGQRSVASFLHRPEYELYDLSKDPDELRNVADDAAYAEVLADLRRRLQTWRQETNDPWLILDRQPQGLSP